ncbi:hypothetical protein KKD80_03850 [Patescibacteria group bacterium]|nr:hypothetical protein [Patescibacteria group bacterium]
MQRKTPVGRAESQIGKIEELMATPERRIKKQGENAIVIRSSGEIEGDWVIEGFNPETGDAIVSKKDKRGNLLKKTIPREEYLSLNFLGSDEMLSSIERDRQKNLDKDMSGRAKKELQRAVEAKHAFARGDIAAVRRYFVEQARDLEKRYSEDDDTQRDIRKKVLKEIEKIEKDLVKTQRHRVDSRGSERDADDLAVINLQQDLGDAKKRFEEANLRLGAGHADLDRLRGFVSILDQEIERRKKAA